MIRLVLRAAVAVHVVVVVGLLAVVAANFGPLPALIVATVVTVVWVVWARAVLEQQERPAPVPLVSTPRFRAPEDDDGVRVAPPNGA